MAFRRTGVVLVLLVAGCALTPDYERPVLDAPEAWREPGADGESIANLAWWELYQDPALARLIESGKLDPADYKQVLLHRILDDEAIEPLSASSKLNAEWSFFEHLRDAGRTTAQRWLARGGRLHEVTRHMLQLFHGRPGARRWRRHLSENAVREGAGLDVLEDALKLVG